MGKEKIQKIYLMLYLRIIFITKSSEDIKRAYSDDIVELLDGIIFLLDYEPDYIYFDLFISQKIYDICTLVREEKFKNNYSLVEKANTIITKINSIVNNNFDSNRKKYFEKQQILRAAYHSSIKTISECDELEEEIALCFKSDYCVLDNLIQNKIVKLEEKPGCILSSINYYLHECPDLCYDKTLLYEFIEISETIKEAISYCYSVNSADKAAYISCCKVGKNIDNKMKNYCKDLGISKNEVKNLKKEIKSNIIYMN